MSGLTQGVVFVEVRFGIVVGFVKCKVSGWGNLKLDVSRW